MSDNIEYNGSWAQPEVIEELKNQEVIASDSTGAEAVAVSNAIGAFARSFLVPTFYVGMYTATQITKTLHRHT